MDRYSIVLKKKIKPPFPVRSEWKNFIFGLLTVQENLTLDDIRPTLVKERGLETLEGLRYARDRIKSKFPDGENAGLAPAYRLKYALNILDEEIEKKNKELSKRERYAAPGVYTTQSERRSMAALRDSSA